MGLTPPPDDMNSNEAGDVRRTVAVGGSYIGSEADAERLIEVLATGLAHSFNNVMASVRASLQVARDRLGPDCLPPEVRTIDSVLARGSSLTRSLLTLAHARQGRARPLYVLDLVEDTLELLEAGLQRQNIRINRGYSRAPVVMASQAALQRSVLRMMMHAAACIDRGQREIRIGFGRSNGLPYIEFVWTRAPEAPQDARELLHLLGSVVRTVDQAGGRVDVMLGAYRTTTVQLFFPPASADVQAPTAPKLESGMPLHALSVLVIDDEAVLRRMVASYLSLHGMHVHTAEDGPHGITLVQNRQFDVVLLDLVMPAMGGEQVLEYLRNIRPEVPVVVLSGLLDDTLAEALLKAGAWGVIAKPLQLDRLLWTCRQAAGTGRGIAVPTAQSSTPSYVPAAV